MTKKLLRWTSNIVLSFIILLGISSIYSIYQTKKYPGQLPSILGYKVMTVLTGSMEPHIEPGDLIVVKKTYPEKLKRNDIITFQNNENTLVTHRIIDLVDQNGMVFFQTKGDANNIADEGLVSSDQVVGSMRFHMPKIGFFLDFIKSPLGLIIMAAVFLSFIVLGIIQKFVPANKETNNSEIKA